MAKSKNKEKFWQKFHKEHLSGADMALFLCSFTGIFGILCHNPRGSLYHLIIFLIFAAFWLVMAFSGGRRLLKGMWLTALIMWGMALAYCAVNWYTVARLDNPESIGQFASAVAGIFYIAAAALLNPVFPLLYRLGYSASEVPAENAVFLFVLCLVCMAVIGLAFLAGWLWEKSRWKKKSPPSAGRFDSPASFKD